MDDRLIELLRSLQQGSTQEEISTLTESALASGVISAEVARIVDELNARLVATQHREALLRALHETATDVSGMRDVEAVLFAIVRRTRALTGSDLAYIALNDNEANEIYIRKSDGVITEEFRTLRMPIGVGVIGRAALGIAPFVTSDYLSDSNVSHLQGTDRIVQAEGVRAVMAVPMNLHGNVIGALLIGDRTAKTYSTETVDLVDTIGKHAAVALDNAERFTSVTQALERLGTEQTTRIEEMAALHELISLDERLIDAVARNDGIIGFLVPVTQIFDNAATVLDSAHGLLASTRPPGKDPRSASTRLPTLVRETIERAFAVGEPQSYVLDGQPFTVVCSKADSTHIATLIIDDLVPRPQHALLKRIAAFLAVLRVFDQAAHHSDQLLQFEVLEALLSDRQSSPAQTQRRAARYGLAPNDSFIVLLVDARRADARRVETTIRSALGGAPALIAQHMAGTSHGQHTCVITAGSADAPHRVHEGLRAAAIDAAVGYAGPVRGFGALATAHVKAERALSTMNALQLTDDLLDGDQLGATGILLDAARLLGVEHDPTGVIGPLVTYDSLHHTELVATAWTFLETQSSLTDTAGALFIHRNTVRQRLDSIARVLGDDWLESKRRLDIHLALRVWRLSTARPA